MVVTCYPAPVMWPKCAVLLMLVSRYEEIQRAEAQRQLDALAARAEARPFLAGPPCGMDSMTGSAMRAGLLCDRLAVSIM